MTNMTLAVPEELYTVIKKHREIKWSEVARQAMWIQAKKLDLMDNILFKSKLTEEEAMAIGREINKGIAKKHGLIR